MVFLWFYLAMMAIILVHELGHFLVAKQQGLHVEVFSLGFGPTLISKKWGGIVYRIALIPLGGYVKLPGMRPDAEDGDHENAFWKAPKKSQALTLAAGSFINIVLGMIIMTIVLMIGFKQYAQDVRTTHKEGPIAKGAQIVAWNGQDPSAPTFAADLDKNGCAQIQTSEGSHRVCGLEGKAFLERYGKRTYIGRNERSFPDAVQASFETTGTVIKRTAQVLSQLVYKKEAREQVSSIVGITQFADDAGQGGFFWLYIALISLSIGLFNLLPILPLDGGHLTVVAYEKIKGTMSPDLYGTYALLGWIVLIALVALGLSNDLRS